MEISLNEKSYTIARLKLRKWLNFEQVQRSIIKAVESKDADEFAKQLCILVSFVLDAPITEVMETPWFNLVSVYNEITELNKFHTIPLVKYPAKEEDVPWDYIGRKWFWWVNTLAKAYGWTIPQIEDLDIDEAVSLLQEILVDQQFEREWQWGLSEVAYPYDEGSKKSKYRPLPKPAWMEKEEPLVINQKVKFKKSMLPVGRIIGENDNERIVH